MTGTTIPAPQPAGKLLEILTDALPRDRQVSIILEPEWPGMSAYVKEGNAAAHALGLGIQYLEVRAPADVDVALARVRRAPPDALYVVPAGGVGARWQRLIAFAMERTLPTIWAAGPYFAREGGLITYGHNPDELAINLKTAKALGLTIPQALLLRADQLIE